MTQERPRDLETEPTEPDGASESKRTEAGPPGESPLPETSAAEDSAAAEAAVEPAPVEPAPVSEPAPSPAAEPGRGEPETQSKFGRPASSLGIRPPIDQSKAGAGPATGLPGPGFPPVAARPPVAPATPSPAPSLPPAPPDPASSTLATVIAPPVPARPPRVAPVVPVVPVAPAPAEDDDEPALTFADRLRRLSPALVTLGIGSIGALLFLVYAMTSHTTPVAVLLSAGVVVTLAFATDALIASVATWRAAVHDEEPGRALLLAIVAGGSAVICAGALGATTVLVLVLTGI